MTTIRGPTLSKLIAFASIICIANGLWTGAVLGTATLAEYNFAIHEESGVVGFVLIFYWLCRQVDLAIPTLIAAIVLIVERSERRIHWLGYFGLAGLLATVATLGAFIAVELAYAG